MKQAIKKNFSYTNKQIIDLNKETSIFPWAAHSKVNPIPIAKAEGSFFWDFDGKKYFDLNSQLMCSNIGHNHPRAIESIIKQARELPFVAPQFASKIRGEYGAELKKITPGDLNHFFFTNSGSECNDAMVKFARAFTGRHKIFSRHRSYHGNTHTAQTLTGDPRRWMLGAQPTPGVIKYWDPYMYRSPFYEKGMTEEEFGEKMIKVLEEQLLYENPHTVAAIINETITGSNGVIIPPKNYYPLLRKLCDKYGILMVNDEVLNGFGRTGKWFAIDHYDTVPDIMCMAKGMTAAYTPLGGIAISDKLIDKFQDMVFPGGSTYQAHPICMANALETIKIYQDEKIIENCVKMGDVMTQLFKELKDKHPSVGEARNKGLLGVIELVKNRETKEPIGPLTPLAEPMVKLGAFLREHGVITFTNVNFLHTHPPLNVKETDLRDAFKVIDKALDITDQYVH